MAQPAITNKILAGLKMSFGALSLLVPSTGLTLFRFPTHAAALVPMRMFGIRDLVFGGLLWTADSPEAIRRALIAGAICDGVDIGIFAYGAWAGDLDFLTADLAAGAGAALVGLALWGLRKQGLPVGVGSGGKI
jgi:hypothetical protein